MKFRLVFNGMVPSTGNKSKPSDVARIRRDFDKQLKQLWSTHPALSVLHENAFKELPSLNLIMDPTLVTRRKKWERDPSGWEPLIPEEIVGSKRYLPLVRKTLHLSSELGILFMCQDDPRELITQGGDLDGRLKTVLDALRIPSLQEQDKTEEKYLPDEVGYVLLESDTLITRIDIEKDRLLLPSDGHAHHCHIVIDVQLNVLEVHDYNTCLL